jgi:hypothetical protein
MIGKKLIWFFQSPGIINVSFLFFLPSFCFGQSQTTSEHTTMSMLPFSGVLFGEGRNTGLTTEPYNITIQMNADCLMERGAECGLIEYDVRDEAKGNFFYETSNCNYIAGARLRGSNAKSPVICYIFKEVLEGNEHPTVPLPFVEAEWSLCEQNDGSWHWDWIWETSMVTATGNLELNSAPTPPPAPTPAPAPTSGPAPTPAPAPTQPPAGLCANTCAFAYDGDCDDGGEGSNYFMCDFGTDCADCGVREE